MQPMERPARSAGFTIIEVLVAVTIVFVIALLGVPPLLLEPRRTWADQEAYDAQAAKLRDACVAHPLCTIEVSR